ncbi:mRNA export factor Gle1 [Nymphalis io]|uniref:mRNA export factor Gle1 n=1 Tax=Inachis io TaxID=171585 RepID=UPI002169CE5A|nr:mRNA export factor Gle1 [Nymphalis io]
MEDTSYSNMDDYTRSGIRSYDISMSETLADFTRLRISALTNAAEISPHITEVTIGPRSPKTKEKIKVDAISDNNNHDFVDLLEDKVGEELRYTLLLKEYEEKLQNNSEDLFKDLFKKMVDTYADTMQRCWKNQSDEFMMNDYVSSKSLEIRARKLQMAKQLRENDNMTVLEKARLDEQNCQMIYQKTIENKNRILDEQNKAIAAVTDSRTKIHMCYNEITNLVQREPLAKLIYEKYVPSLNTVIGNITAVMDFCKTGTITDEEVKQSEVLSWNIESIKQKIIDDINLVKQQELLKKQKEEEESRQKEIQEIKEQEAKAAETARLEQALVQQAKRAQSMFYSEKNYLYYKELKSFLDCYESSYKDLLENSNLKKFKFDCQKAVNTPINALSSVSGTHMRDKFDKLAKLLRGEKVQVLDTFVTASQHPQGLHYCTALLAKKIVRQGDLLVSSNPEAAFPLAAVTVALWSQFPEFGKLLEANFHRQCPYLVPMMLPQKEGQTDKEFYMSRGYTYNDEGVVEKQDKFLKRMSGIFRLHCAIWIAKTPKFMNVSNPHSLRYGWQWLASFINLKPEPDLSATLIHDFFTVCGSEFLGHYGKQCKKILKLLSTEYLSILQNIDEGGPKTRFEVFLQSVLKTGHIPPPNGLLPPNTW